MPKDLTYFDEETLYKVRNAFAAEGFSDALANEVINVVLNAGLLFRERVSHDG